MKPVTMTVIVAALTLAMGGAGGYWYAHRQSVTPGDLATSASANPPPSSGGAKGERKILYYRNPMGLPDTSPVPKKDPMGMDYIPVYEGDDSASGGKNELRIAADRVQKLGVRTEAATVRNLAAAIKATGRIEIDERRLTTVTPKVEGFVERLHVSATGQPIARGQPLFEMYSPELVSLQREYAIAMQAVDSLANAGPEAQASMRRLAEASLARLKTWDISDEQIQALAQTGNVRRTLTFRSPVSGVVLEKKVVQGMRFMPGEPLYQIGDLSSIWVIADVNEQDIGQVRTGSTAKLRINAYPEKTFTGKVSYVYPTLKPETRTVPVRVELANPDQILKPGMFADVELAGSGRKGVLAVPVSAVIDSGKRRVVLVQKGEGRFEPRAVELGYRSGDYVEVLSGVTQGEPVVTTANFLIDAESNLRAAIGGFGAAAGAGGQGERPGASTTGSATPSTTVGHRAEGTVDAIDPKTGTLSITHGPVPTLKWPGMTMEFVVANSALLQGLRPGSAVQFEFVERKPGEWVITRIAAGNAAASAHQR